ncbi:MurR/RpiR family transcriptional regulator [Xylocopilactobacillus apis]|uniref:RpiR family transcriptional regulator n=1 Tax=Xylocopilactobacillus apis TaxID=2932183 RepID=A0AAU9D556_9LACO|nr:MurR/RpiR family transcriptional regulator [Xylocopilactobacillus apis]BDR55952.1 RpiR family transcriptional regulator [Xylocopilactobacillus apis]
MKNNLSTSEQYLWDYVDQHRTQIPNLSIVQLGEKANVSTATIVRAMKKRGYSGYTNFRQAVIQENNDINNFPNFRDMSQKIKEVVLKNQDEVLKTIQKIDVGDIEDAVQKIKVAKKIYIFAQGFSEMTAKEMQIKLQLLNKTAEFHSDPNIIIPISKRIKPQDLIIYVSLNGETQSLLQSSQTALKNNVSTITITTNPDGSLMEYSEISIVGYKQKSSFFPEFEVHSRLPLEVISRILLDAYAIRIKDQT